MPLTSNKPIVGIFFSQIDKVGLKWPKLARSQFKKQVSKNQFFIDLFEKVDIFSKMYICEISKFKISGHKSQKRPFYEHWDLDHLFVDTLYMLSTGVALILSKNHAANKRKNDTH